MFGKVFCDKLVIISEQKNADLEYLLTVMNTLKIGSTLCNYEHEHYIRYDCKMLEQLKATNALSIFYPMHPCYSVSFDQLLNNEISVYFFFEKYPHLLDLEKTQLLNMDFDLFPKGLKSFDEFFMAIKNQIPGNSVEPIDARSLGKAEELDGCAGINDVDGCAVINDVNGYAVMNDVVSGVVDEDADDDDDISLSSIENYSDSDYIPESEESSESYVSDISYDSNDSDNEEF